MKERDLRPVNTKTEIQEHTRTTLMEEHRLGAESVVSEIDNWFTFAVKEKVLYSALLFPFYSSLCFHSTTLHFKHCTVNSTTTLHRSDRLAVAHSCRRRPPPASASLCICLFVCLFWHTYTCTHCPSLRCGCAEVGVFVEEITLHCFQFTPSYHPLISDSIGRTAVSVLPRRFISHGSRDAGWLDVATVNYSPLAQIIGWSGSVDILKYYSTNTGNTYFWFVSVYVSRSVRTPHTNRDWSAASNLQQQ